MWICVDMCLYIYVFSTLHKHARITSSRCNPYGMLAGADLLCERTLIFARLQNGRRVTISLVTSHTPSRNEILL